MEDLTKALQELHPAAAGDFAVTVLELYQKILAVYAPSQATYGSALHATAPDAVNGFASSTSNSPSQ